MFLTVRRGGGLAVLMALATFSASAATPMAFDGTDSGRIEQAIAALAEVDPENPNAKFHGWRTCVFEGNVWQTTGESYEKSVKSTIFV